MIDCTPQTSLSSVELLGTIRWWGYESIIDILMYLANNTPSDIAHAVHACTRYTHKYKNTYATVVKYILRYLQGIVDQGWF